MPFAPLHIWITMSQGGHWADRVQRTSVSVNGRRPELCTSPYSYLEPIVLESAFAVIAILPEAAQAMAA